MRGKRRFQMRVSKKRGIAIATLVAACSAAVALTDTPKRTELRVEIKPIKPEVIYEISRTIGSGRILKVEEGVPGKIVKTYTVSFVNGKPTHKILLSTKVVKARPVKFYMGASGFQASRSSFGRAEIKDMHATGYDASPRTIPGGSGRTATGRKATYGCVAVDPKVIPLGTHLYIEGYGYGLACDKGSAIKGNRVDLCFNSRSEALAFGRKKVRVHVLSSR